MICDVLRHAALTVAACAATVMTANASALLLDLVYEFDGNSVGTTSFGTIELTQNGTMVDIAITANTVNLAGGDTHEFYFNLPDAIDLNSLAISNSAGVSNRPILAFTLLGANPSVAGGAGASFDTGVSFGNGGGPPGNGTLTTATFSLTATAGLLVSDFVSETSTPNNTPPVFMAVHFQGTGIFNADSETVGTPEPATAALLGLGGLAMLRRRP